MKVLGIVSYKVFPAQMGGQKGVALFYQYLLKQCEVELVVSKENKIEDIHFCKSHNFLFNHNKGLFNIIYLSRLIRLIKTQQIDIIIIEHSYFGWLGLLLKLFTKKPFVIHSHNIEAHRFKIVGNFWWKVYLPYEKLVHKQADFSFFISEEDRNFAINKWQVKPAKCSVITYGTELQHPPSINEKISCRYEIIKKYSLQNDTKIFLFAGTLDYAPNVDVLKIITQELIPLLVKHKFNYKIIVCGNHLSTEWRNKLALFPQIINAGFVEDIDIYFKGADAFINPSFLSTGIKVKIIEALANGLTVIANEAAAKGIDKAIEGNKLIIIKDADDSSFASKMMDIQPGDNQTPGSFYAEFYWKNIINKALLSLRSL